MHNHEFLNDQYLIDNGLLSCNGDLETFEIYGRER